MIHYRKQRNKFCPNCLIFKYNRIHLLHVTVLRKQGVTLRVREDPERSRGSPRNKFSNAVLFIALKKHCSRYETYCYGCCQKSICKVYSTDYKVCGYTSQETRPADISVFSFVRPVNFSQSKLYGNRLCGCIIDYRIVQSFPSFLTKIDDGFTTR